MLVQIKNISFAYPDGYKAICGLGLEIDSGESVALVGANGAGKSTLFDLMVGVRFPSEGEIFIDDILLEKKTLREIRCKVGMVFQNPDDQLFMTSVYDDVAFGPRNAMVPEAEIAKKVETVLEELNIAKLRDKMPAKLSGGEKRMAAIASVIAMSPNIILFDEPSSFLDPKARRNLIHVLNRLETTKIIATHDLDMALDCCNRVVVMKNGRIFADGPADKILFDEALLMECGLELPFCLQKHKGIVDTQNKKLT